MGRILVRGEVTKREESEKVLGTQMTLDQLIVAHGGFDRPSAVEAGVNVAMACAKRGPPWCEYDEDSKRMTFRSRQKQSSVVTSDRWEVRESETFNGGSGSGSAGSQPAPLPPPPASQTNANAEQTKPNAKPNAEGAAKAKGKAKAKCKAKAKSKGAASKSKDDTKKLAKAADEIVAKYSTALLGAR